LIEQGPPAWQVEFNLGNSLMQLKRPNEAIRHYEESIRLDPNQAPVRTNLAVACVQLNRRDDAVRHLQEALRIDPEFGPAKQALNRLLKSQ
jgi:tetratricopeptide (TPR) repeat protein